MTTTRTLFPRTYDLVQTRYSFVVSAGLLPLPHVLLCRVPSNRSTTEDIDRGRRRPDNNTISPPSVRNENSKAQRESEREPRSARLIITAGVQQGLKIVNPSDSRIVPLSRARTLFISTSQLARCYRRRIRHFSPPRCARSYGVSIVRCDLIDR